MKKLSKKEAWWTRRFIEEGIVPNVTVDPLETYIEIDDDGKAVSMKYKSFGKVRIVDVVPGEPQEGDGMSTESKVKIRPRSGINSQRGELNCKVPAHPKSVTQENPIIWYIKRWSNGQYRYGWIWAQCGELHHPFMHWSADSNSWIPNERQQWYKPSNPDKLPKKSYSSFQELMSANFELFL